MIRINKKKPSLTSESEERCVVTQLTIQRYFLDALVLVRTFIPMYKREYQMRQEKKLSSDQHFPPQIFLLLVANVMVE